MSRFSVILSLCIFISCLQTKPRINDNLIKAQSTYVMGEGDQATGYYADHANFIKPYLSQKQNGDTLVVTTLKEINSCGKTIGDIRFSGDSLLLETRQISNESCTSVEFHKFTFYIHNPIKKKYIIVSTE